MGLIVIYTGMRVIRDTSLELIDTMPEPALLAELRSVAASVEGVWEVEKVMARKTGLQYHADLHVHVDPAISVEASHQIAGAVRRRLRDEVPAIADVLVHVQPGRR